MRRLRFLLGLGILSLVGTAFAAGSTTVVVPAAVFLTDTTVAVLPGTALIVTAAGRWDVCNGNCPSGPDGATNGDLGFCIGGLPAGELLGSLDGATFFAIGSGPTKVTGSGELSLGPNDCAYYPDNSGELTATVIVYPISKDACKDGGWQNLSRQDGTAFKNQGNCVSYVNTGK